MLLTQNVELAFKLNSVNLGHHEPSYSLCLKVYDTRMSLNHLAGSLSSLFSLDTSATGLSQKYLSKALTEVFAVNCNVSKVYFALYLASLRS